MARPTKCRRVEFFPDNTSFVPKGRDESDKVVLKIEELEAIRLKDLEGLTQDECARRMEVSRQTFQNIIYRAHKKIALGLTQGKSIEIRGGHFTTDYCEFTCTYCKETYEIDYNHNRDLCPICGSEEVFCKKKTVECHKWCEK